MRLLYIFLCYFFFGKILYLEIYVFRNIFIFIIVLKKKNVFICKSDFYLKKLLFMVEFVDILFKLERKYYRF